MGRREKKGGYPPKTDPPKKKKRKKKKKMALWHMDRARYYASVGDDARALRHLTMFGTTEEDRVINEKRLSSNVSAASKLLVPQLGECRAKLEEAQKHNEDHKRIESKLRKERDVCNHHREACTQMKTTLKDDRGRLEGDNRLLNAELQALRVPHERERAEPKKARSGREETAIERIPKLSARIQELQKKVDEAETAEAARKRQRQGGCSVM